MRLSPENARKFWAAITALQGDDLLGIGYINVATGEVAFLASFAENRELDDQGGTEELTPQVMEDRRKIRAEPDAWVRIPRYANDPRYGAPSNEVYTRFARDFLEANGMDFTPDESGRW